MRHKRGRHFVRYPPAALPPHVSPGREPPEGNTSVQVRKLQQNRLVAQKVAAGGRGCQQDGRLGSNTGLLMSILPSILVVGTLLSSLTIAFEVPAWNTEVPKFCCPPFFPPTKLCRKAKAFWLAAGNPVVDLLVAGAFYELSSGIVDFYSLDKNGIVVDL